jgi:N6-adenosine-specific RNA methylase IME4
MKQYGVILCDPPWEYDISHRNGAAGKHYQTMALGELMAMPVNALAADDCVLLMWGTWPKLAEACLPLMAAWGFEYVTGFPWVKIIGFPKIDLFDDLRIRPAFGTGYWIRGATEPILIGRRGKASPPDRDWAGILCERMQHSRKPERLHHYAMSMPGPYLELFARRSYPGFDIWGNQVESTVTMEPTR